LVYHYKKSFETHLSKEHNITKVELETYCKKAQTLEVDDDEEHDELILHEIELLCNMIMNQE
jgi:hypothetical protein